MGSGSGHRVSSLNPNPHVGQAVVFTLLREPLSRVVADWLHCENEYLREGALSQGQTLCSRGAKAP